MIVTQVLLDDIAPELAITELAGPHRPILFAQISTDQVKFATGAAKYPTTDSAVMLPPVKFVKSAVAVEAVRDVFVWDPFVLGAHRQANCLEDLIVHFILLTLHKMIKDPIINIYTLFAHQIYARVGLCVIATYYVISHFVVSSIFVEILM